MKLLITGVHGFIGQKLCRLALNRGHVVNGMGLANVPPSNLAKSSYFRNDGNPNRLSSMVRQVRPDICIHAAGCASVAASVEEPGKDFAAGPALTFSLVDALRREAPECRLVLVSSAAVYGNPKRLPVSETAPITPISPYGFHKAQSEMICREFTQVYGMKTASVRVFSAYGKGLRRQVLWDIFRKILQHNELNLRGTGNESRDFLHVNDVAAGLLLVAVKAPLHGEAYNLASGQEVSIRELAAMSSRALGVDIEPRFDGQVPKGDPLHWRGDIELISKLGFAPQVSLEAGVRAYAAWCYERLGEPRQYAAGVNS